MGAETCNRSNSRTSWHLTSIAFSCWLDWSSRKRGCMGGNTPGKESTLLRDSTCARCCIEKKRSQVLYWAAQVMLHTTGLSQTERCIQTLNARASQTTTTHIHKADHVYVLHATVSDCIKCAYRWVKWSSLDERHQQGTAADLSDFLHSTMRFWKQRASTRGHCNKCSNMTVKIAAHADRRGLAVPAAEPGTCFLHPRSCLGQQSTDS